MTATTSKPIVFIDSNVWLYAFIVVSDPSKSKNAKQLIAENAANLVISSQVVIEVAANLIKKLAMDENGLRHFITDTYHTYQVINVDERIMLKASDLRRSYSLSYWDSLIVAAALAGNATILYSEDMRNGLVVEKQLTIVNPFTP